MVGGSSGGGTTTRREFVALCAALALAGCGGEDDEPETKGPPKIAQADAELLRDALMVTYGLEAAKSGRLKTQETEHAAALAAAVKDLDFRPPPRPRTATGGDAVQLTRAALGFYVDLLPKLSKPAIRGTVAAILANEAQHLVLLDRAGGAFVPA